MFIGGSVVQRILVVANNKISKCTVGITISITMILRVMIDLFALVLRVLHIPHKNYQMTNKTVVQQLDYTLVLWNYHRISDDPSIINLFLPHNCNTTHSRF